MHDFVLDLTGSHFLAGIIGLIFAVGFWLATPFIIYFSIKFIYKAILKIRYLIKEQTMLKHLATSGIRDIDNMDGLQFETYLRALFKALGYHSKVTMGSHDYGADLIMKSDGKKAVIQAKRYGYQNKVGIDAVQQIHAAKTYYKADQSFVMTNSLFTKNARELAKACDVQLYNRYELSKLINQVNPGETPDNVKRTTPAANRTCPDCGGTLVQRQSKGGNLFMGCSNYPKCTHTEPLAT